VIQAPNGCIHKV